MDDKTLKFADVEDVEIFASGTWNGDPYSGDDLDVIVQSFEETKDRLKPYLKLGHGEKQKLLAEDELPAAGWVSSIRRDGNKILASFKNIPTKIYEIIKRGGYRRVSVELFKDIKIGEKFYPLALKAVSLLGGETPAVHTLDDILSLYGSQEPAVVFKDKLMTAAIRKYEIDSDRFLANDKSTEDIKVNELEAMKEENAKLKEANVKLSEENKALSAGLDQMKSDISEIKKFSDEMKAQNDKLKSEKKLSDISAKVDKLIQDKKIVPAQADKLKAILGANVEVKPFKFGEKEYSNIEELLFSFVESGNAPINTEEETDLGEKKLLDVDSKAKAYAEKHSVSYKEALIAVSTEKGQ